MVRVLVLNLASSIILYYKKEVNHKSSHIIILLNTIHQQLFHDLFNKLFLELHIQGYQHKKKSFNLILYT